MHDSAPSHRLHTPRLVPEEPAGYLGRRDMAWVQPYSNLIKSMRATIQRELVLNAPSKPRESNGVGPNGEETNKSQCAGECGSRDVATYERFYR